MLPKGPQVKTFVPGVELAKVRAARRWDLVRGLW